MPIYVTRLREGVTATTVPELGISVAVGAISDATSELADAESADYATLQQKQLSSEIRFYRTIDVSSVLIIAYAPLTLLTEAEAFASPNRPLMGTLSFQSPIDFDLFGYILRSVRIKSVGAYEIDFFGSIDDSVTDPNAKDYDYCGRITGGPERKLFDIPTDVFSKLTKYRWLRAEQVRGSEGNLITFMATQNG